MLKIIKSFIKVMDRQKKQIYFSLLLNFIDGIFITIPFFIVYFIINQMPEFSSHSKALGVSEMTKYTFMIIISLIVRVILNYFILLLRSGAGYKVMCEERKIIGRGMRTVSLGSLSDKTIGDMVSTLTSDIAFMEIEGLGIIEKAANGIPSFIIALAILLYFDYRLLIIAVILLIPTWFAYKNLFFIQKKHNINRQKFISDVTEQTLEFIKGIHVLKTYNMTEKAFHKTKKIYQDLKNFSIKVEFLHIVPGSIFQFGFRFMVSCLIFFSAYLFMKGNITFADTFLLIVSSLMLFLGIEAMGIFSIFSNMTKQSIDRINKIKDMPKLNDTFESDNLERFDIEFKNVSFAYDKRQVLNDINFYVQENTMMALVGLSGSGKTTITNLIARFWDIEDGEILIGHKEIKSIDYENLLQNISFVFQEVFLFNDTIMNNIKIGNQKASDEEVYAASKKAACHDFIMNLENGYNTSIGELGDRLSGGEKQRISIARAILKDAPIVLLDETTSAVDVENERQIQDALEELLRNKTVIMIAHKLSTIKEASQILVLDEGQIIQKGIHKDLVKQEGLYKRMWDLAYKTDNWNI